MTELYIRILPIEPWRKAMLIKDAEATGMAQVLRQEGYKVAMVHVQPAESRRPHESL